MSKTKAVVIFKELEAINNMLDMFKEKFSLAYIVFEEESTILCTLNSDVSYEIFSLEYAMENGIKYLYLDESTETVLVRVTKEY